MKGTLHKDYQVGPGRVFMQWRKLWGPGPLTAVGLIFAVFTVIFFITRPAHGDAAPTGAGKVIEGAPRPLHTWR